jgi:hypothetical protein
MAPRSTDFLAVDPDLAHRAATAEPGRIIRAAELGRLEAVRLMAELVFYVNVVRQSVWPELGSPARSEQKLISG